MAGTFYIGGTALVERVLLAQAAADRADDRDLEPVEDPHGPELLATQAFVYNAVIFTFSTVLTGLFKVGSSTAGLYLIPFGIANFLGALLLGRFFDTIGPKAMIAATY